MIAVSVNILTWYIIQFFSLFIPFRRDVNAYITEAKGGLPPVYKFLYIFEDLIFGVIPFCLSAYYFWRNIYFDDSTVCNSDIFEFYHVIDAIVQQKYSGFVQNSLEISLSYYFENSLIGFLLQSNVF